MLFADGGRIARVEDKQQSAAWGGGELPTSHGDVGMSDVNFCETCPPPCEIAAGGGFVMYVRLLFIVN